MMTGRRLTSIFSTSRREKPDWRQTSKEFLFTGIFFARIE